MGFRDEGGLTMLGLGKLGAAVARLASVVERLADTLAAANVGLRERLGQEDWPLLDGPGPEAPAPAAKEEESAPARGNGKRVKA
jgi:hypothetical protein